MDNDAYIHEDKSLKLIKKYEQIAGGNIDGVEIEEVKIDDLVEELSEKQVVDNASNAIKRLEQSAPKLKVIDLPPDKEIAYKQKYVSQCKLCNHPRRDEAELIYAQSSNVPNRVVLWFKDVHKEHFTWECVATHMKNHCEWDKPLVDFISKISYRQEELSIVSQDRIKWNLDALTAANLDLLSQIDSLTGEDSIKTYNAVCNGIKVQAQLLKLQHDTSGAQAQAKAMIEANNRKLVTFLEKLLSILDDEKKKQVLDLMREFQNEENRSI